MIKRIILLFFIVFLFAAVLGRFVFCLFRGTGENKTKIILIGLDGASWDVIRPLIEASRLPNLARLQKNGSSGILKSITPMTSAMLWTCMATGEKKEKHGITDFCVKIPGEYNIIPTNSNLRTAKAFWNVLSDYRKTVGVVNWWVSWPAEQVNGFIISENIFYPDADKSVPYLTYPEYISNTVFSLKKLPSGILNRELAAVLGSLSSAQYRFDSRLCSQIGLERDSPDYKGFLALRDLPVFIKEDMQVVMVGKHFLKKFSPELFAIYIKNLDGVQHDFFPEYKSRSSSNEAQNYGAIVPRYYEFVDNLIGQLLTGVNLKDCTVIIVSDHGFAHESLYRGKDIVNLNFVFEKFGWLAYKNKEVDWEKTKIYDFTGQSAGYEFFSARRQIYVNLSGRERKGIIKPGTEFEDFRKEVKRKLEDIKTRNNINLFRVNIPVISNPNKDNQSPDLVVKINPDVDLSEDCLIADNPYPISRIVLFRPVLGSHHLDGVIIAAGKHIKKNFNIQKASLFDVVPTIFTLMNIPLANDMDGKPLVQIFEEGYLAHKKPNHVDSYGHDRPFIDSKYLNSPIESAIKQRLKNLGYLQ